MTTCLQKEGNCPLPAARAVRELGCGNVDIAQRHPAGRERQGDALRMLRGARSRSEDGNVVGLTGSEHRVWHEVRVPGKKSIREHIRSHLKIKTTRHRIRIRAHTNVQQ